MRFVTGRNGRTGRGRGGPGRTRPRNPFALGVPPDYRMLPEVNLVLVAIVGVLLSIVFFIFLFIRRTVTAFTEGLRGGSER